MMITMNPTNPTIGVTVVLLLAAALCWLPVVRAPLRALARAAWGMMVAAWRRWRAFALLERVDPPLAQEFRKLEAAAVDDAPLVVRYCLMNRAGKKLEVEGMPGHVALYTTYSKANGRRRRGETVHKILVRSAALAPTLRRTVVSVVAWAVLMGAACDGGPAALLADTDTVDAQPSPPALLRCTRVLADTLWIDGVPHVEYLTVCGAP